MKQVYTLVLGTVLCLCTGFCRRLDSPSGTLLHIFNVFLTRQIRHLTCITFQLRQGALY